MGMRGSSPQSIMQHPPHAALLTRSLLASACAKERSKKPRDAIRTVASRCYFHFPSSLPEGMRDCVLLLCLVTFASVDSIPHTLDSWRAAPPPSGLQSYTPAAIPFLRFYFYIHTRSLPRLPLLPPFTAHPYRSHKSKNKTGTRRSLRRGPGGLRRRALLGAPRGEHPLEGFVCCYCVCVV